jgi:putative tryptophan/tyrosine transport system substrate-binding protein
MAETKRILALAVGDPMFSQIIDNPGKSYGVRPYISGLIEGLTKLGRTLGADYVIDYQQRWHDDIHAGQAFREIGNASLIYAMSTTVTRAAGGHNKELPIVFSNCSEHAAEELVAAKRATGFSAKRTQTAGDCFDRFFKTVPTLEEVFILHKPDYDVSDNAVQLVTQAAQERGVRPITITVTSRSQLEEKLAQLPERTAGSVAKVGVHVTPVDLLFAATPWIIGCVQGTKHIPAFFPVTDWVPSGLGGYGVPQFRCGERSAGHVDQILWPTGPQSSLLPLVSEATKDDFEWVVSRAAAEALGLRPPTAADVRIV